MRTVESPEVFASLRLRVARAARSPERIAMGLVVLASVAIRIRSAWGAFVAPDEAIVLEISAGRGPAEIWEAGASNPHPPLVYLLLAAWLRFGRGDLWVRLLPIVLTVLALVLVRRTAGALLGRSRSLIAVALIAASPTLVPATTEVRPYPLLLLLAAASTEALRLSTRPSPEGRTLAALGFAALSALAVASHYSAVFLLAGLFPWAAVRAVRNLRGAGDRLLAAAAWTVPASAFALFWIGHISHQVSGGLAGGLLAGTYARGLGDAGGTGPLGFLARQSWHLLGWLCGPLAAFAAVALTLGSFRLARRRGGDVLVVLAPLLAGMAAALLGKYPYGGYRQSTFLLVPLALGVAAGIPAVLLRRRLRTAVAIGFLACGVALLAPDQAPSGMERSFQRRADLDAALASIRPREATDRPIVLADLSSSVLLGWYLGEPGVDYWAGGPGSSAEVALADLRLRIGWVWAHDGDSLGRDLNTVREGAGREAPLRLFAVWPSESLARHLDPLEGPPALGTSKRFGRGLLTATLR